MWKLLIVIVLVIGTALAAECVRELKIFQVTHYRVGSKKLNAWKGEKKIILLSDLHNKVYGYQNEPLLEAIRNEKPDLILVAGDMLTGKVGKSAEPAAAFVSQLPKICPVYYGNGNHEQRMKEEPEIYGNVYMYYKKELQRSGVHFLENSKTEVTLDEVPIEIYGIEIPMEYYAKFKKHRMPVSVIEQYIGKADSSKYQIVISHNPTYVKVFKQWGADLVLSGHLHGGIIRIPGRGGLITPQAIPFPKCSGEITVDGDARYIVSRGLGTHTVNVRLFNKAEVVVIHLQGELT